MTYLTKEEIFFERDNEGNVLPIEVALETIPDKPLVKVTPLTKGELSKLVSATKSNETDIDTDIDIIVKHCIEPSFNDEDKNALKKAGKAVHVNAIILAILSISSGISQQKIVDEGRKALSKKVSDFPNQ